MSSAVIYHFSLFFFLVVTMVSKQNTTLWKRRVTGQLAPAQHPQPAVLGPLTLSSCGLKFLGLKRPTLAFRISPLLPPPRFGVSLP